MGKLHTYQPTSKGVISSKEGFIEAISGDFIGKINAYTLTHDSSRAPETSQVDMLKLKLKARSLVTNHFNKTLPILMNFQQVTDSILNQEEIEISDLSLDQFLSSSEELIENKKENLAFVCSLDLMFLMIMIRSLAHLSERKDKVLSNSCHAIVGYIMEELTDVNDGEIPEKFVRILKASGLNITRLGEASTADRKEKGPSPEELETKHEICQGLLQEPSSTTIH